MQSMHKEEYDKAKLEKDPQVYDAIHEKVYFTCESCEYKTACNNICRQYMKELHIPVTTVIIKRNKSKDS